MGKKIAANLFRYASQSGASHLVILNRDRQVTFDYYFPGGEKRSFSLPQTMEPDILAGLRQILDIRPGELTAQKPIRLNGPSGRLDFHVTITPDDNKEKIVISILDRNQRNWRLNQLGLQTNQKKEISNFLSRRSGLLIVSAPSGHGKSATAFALGAEADTETKSVYVLEDFPEISSSRFNSLRQTEDNWTRILRCDSDLIIADSLEEKKNLRNALVAAATGRLVIGTISAQNAFEVLAKVLQIDLPLKLKLDSLKMIINQRLTDLDRTFQPARSNARQTIGLFEILKITPRLKQIISEGTDSSDKKFWTGLISEAISEGFKPLALDRQQKIGRRITKND